jgi:hypothetical protein
MLLHQTALPTAKLHDGKSQGLLSGNNEAGWAILPA